MSTPNTERRAGYKEIDEKLEALVGLLTVHMTGEEREIHEIKELLKEYFDKLDAHTHVKHHDFVGGEMSKIEKDEAWWDKVKADLVSKGIVFASGAILTYVGALLWGDFTIKVNKAAVQEQQQEQQVQQKPPVIDPNVIYVPVPKRSIPSDTPNHP